MCFKRDIDISELNTGPVRHRKYKERHGKDQAARKVRYCLDCGKDGYPTKEAVRVRISTLVSERRMVGPEVFAVHPYLCGHGWWHYGRDRRVINLLREQRQKDEEPPLELEAAA